MARGFSLRAAKIRRISSLLAGHWPTERSELPCVTTDLFASLFLAMAARTRRA